MIDMASDEILESVRVERDNLRDKLAASEDRCAQLEGALREARKQLIACDAALREDGGFKDHAPRIVHTRRAISDADRALAAAVPPKSPDVELYEAQERFVDARRSAAVPPNETEAELRAHFAGTGETLEDVAAETQRVLLHAIAEHEGEHCGKRCAHGSPCMLTEHHAPTDRHQTEHGCVFYDDVKPAAAVPQPPRDRPGVLPTTSPKTAEEWADAIYRAPCQLGVGVNISELCIAAHTMAIAEGVMLAARRMRRHSEEDHTNGCTARCEAAAVPQPPPKQLVDEQFNDNLFDEMVRQGSPDPRRRISNVTKVYPMGQDKGPAVPQPPKCTGWCAGRDCGEPCNRATGHTCRACTLKAASDHHEPAGDGDCTSACTGPHRFAKQARIDALRGEAPPPGEPTHDPIHVPDGYDTFHHWLLARLENAYWHAQSLPPRTGRIDIVLDGLDSCRADVRKYIAAQPASASPPRDESVPPPGFRKMVESELQLLDDRIAEGKGTWPHRDYVTDEQWARWQGKRDQLRSVLRWLNEAAPTVSREVAEARVYACPRCATSMQVDPSMKPQPSANREVDEAAVRASVAASERDWIAQWLERSGLVSDQRALDDIRLGTYMLGAYERPAASGKDGAT